jgi:hypothetical protein
VLVSSGSGSAPIETVALITLLLLPIGPGVILYDQISNQLAAESIARHGVRAAMLESQRGSFGSPDEALQVLALSWQKPLTGYRVFRSGELINLEIVVGNARALATLGIEPVR